MRDNIHAPESCIRLQRTWHRVDFVALLAAAKLSRRLKKLAQELQLCSPRSRKGKARDRKWKRRKALHVKLVNRALRNHVILETIQTQEDFHGLDVLHKLQHG